MFEAFAMTPSETLTLAAYFFVVIILAVYGWHRYYLVYVYMKNRGREPKATAPLDPMPVVTGTFDNGSRKELFSFYPDEIRFDEGDLVGLTEAEAHDLYRRKDLAYLRT